MKMPGEGNNMKSGWRYPPALSERLIYSESPECKNGDYRISAEKMRQLVITEIIELLNHTNAENEIDGDKYPNILSSSMNFGLPPRHFFQIRKTETGLNMISGRRYYVLSPG